MNNLDSGIAAYKAGKRDEARQFFIAALKEDQRNERAWGWMYQVANSDAERIECMRRALQINPNNAKAKELLEKLTAPPFMNELPKPVQPVARPAPIEPQKQNSTMRYILAGAISLVVVFCCLLALTNTDMPTSPSTLGQLPSSNNSIRYVLKGTAGSVTATYFNETGGMEQIQVGLPWQMDMKVGAGAALSLVGTMMGSGSITCEIWVNGQLVKQSTSSADYGSVTCSDITIR